MIPRHHTSSLLSVYAPWAPVLSVAPPPGIPIVRYAMHLAAPIPACKRRPGEPRPVTGAVSRSAIEQNMPMPQPRRHVGHRISPTREWGTKEAADVLSPSRTESTTQRSLDQPGGPPEFNKPTSRRPKRPVRSNAVRSGAVARPVLTTSTPREQKAERRHARHAPYMVERVGALLPLQRHVRRAVFEPCRAARARPPPIRAAPAFRCEFADLFPLTVGLINQGQLGRRNSLLPRVRRSNTA